MTNENDEIIEETVEEDAEEVEEEVADKDIQWWGNNKETPNFW